MSKFLLIFFLASFTQCYCPEKHKKTESPAPVKTSTDIGELAPDLSYLNPEGTDISLYSLRGKIVLLDFWASWCPPCRRENPNVVTIYKDFMDKKFRNGNGFTIYSVSCDKAKESWIDAIATDQLLWENHVSDLKGWEAEAAYIYNIKMIPSNVLIDGEGIILAKDLHGTELRTFLETLLVK